MSVRESELGVCMDAPVRVIYSLEEIEHTKAKNFTPENARESILNHLATAEINVGKMEGCIGKETPLLRELKNELQKVREYALKGEIEMAQTAAAHAWSGTLLKMV